MTHVVTFGEIMLRLSPPGQLRFSQARGFDAIYGGGESNVAVSLANYGIPVSFVTRLPNHEIGEACLQFLRQYGVGTEYILRGGERLGIYFLGSDLRGSNLVPLDRHHPGDFTRRGRSLPGGRQGGPQAWPDRFQRPELPRQAVEMGQGRR